MSAMTYKCPNCGGPLEFKTASQSFKCDFCLSEFNQEEIKKIESYINQEDEVEEETVNDPEFEAQGRIYSCSSCGAEIVTDATTAASFCYYCHSPAIFPGQLSGKYRPAKVLPFKFDKTEATKRFVKWCKKKPLLSRKFISKSQLEYVSGIYVPFWLFDCQVRGHISATGKNTRRWQSGDKNYTEVKYYDVRRTGRASFLGIPADGSKKIEDNLMETLEPFDYSQMEEFSMSYLSGFMAQKYDMDADQVYGRVAERIQAYSEKLLRNSIHGYQSVTVTGTRMDVNHRKATYVLLPTWMLTYQYKDKTYMFAMNGQTGKIAGQLPVSLVRALVWFAIIGVIIFTLLMLGGIGG